MLLAGRLKGETDVSGTARRGGGSPGLGSAAGNNAPSYSHVRTQRLVKTINDKTRCLIDETLYGHHRF